MRGVQDVAICPFCDASAEGFIQLADFRYTTLRRKYCPGFSPPVVPGIDEGKGQVHIGICDLPLEKIVNVQDWNVDKLFHEPVIAVSIVIDHGFQFWAVLAPEEVPDRDVLPQQAAADCCAEMGFPTAWVAGDVKPFIFAVLYIVQRRLLGTAGELVRCFVCLEGAVSDQILQPGASEQTQALALCHTFALAGEQATGLVHPVNHAFVVADWAVYAVLFVERSGDGVIDSVL